jgi:hypothetical protein
MSPGRLVSPSLLSLHFALGHSCPRCCFGVFFELTSSVDPAGSRAGSADRPLCSDCCHSLPGPRRAAHRQWRIDDLQRSPIILGLRFWAALKATSSAVTARPDGRRAGAPPTCSIFRSIGWSLFYSVGRRLITRDWKLPSALGIIAADGYARLSRRKPSSSAAAYVYNGCCCLIRGI